MQAAGGGGGGEGRREEVKFFIIFLKTAVCPEPGGGAEHGVCVGRGGGRGRGGSACRLDGGSLVKRIVLNTLLTETVT